jgi:selenium-binding protein 1
VIDVKDPLKAKIHKIIEPEEVFAKTGYSRPHTIHCGPEGIYVSTLGGGGEDGTDGPPGIFIMDCETFDILGRYEMDRGEQDKHYDFWWNLPRDYMVSSEWGLPPQFENGIVAEDLLSNKYGHKIHFWNLRERKNVQTIDLGANHQMALEIRPAHDPAKDYGFCGVVVDTTNLQGAIFTWWQKDDGTFEAKKTITIDPRPEKAENLPPLLQGFEAVPPLVTDIDLSLDDKYLYVACWGLGEMHQYDVSDPMNPKLAGKVEIGGIARGTRIPTARISPIGPQMVEISRDGKRVYWTNSLYSTWDNQFYPDGEGGQMVMANVGENGGLELDPGFLHRVPEGLSQPPDPSGRRRLFDRQLLLPVRLTRGRADNGNGPVVGRCRLGHLSRGQSRHGLAAGGVRGADGPRARQPVQGAPRAGGRASSWPWRRSCFRSRRSCSWPNGSARSRSGRRASSSRWALPADQPTPSEVPGPRAALAAGALVLPRGDGPWRGADAGADLPRHLPDGGDRCRPRGRRRPDGGQCTHRGEPSRWRTRRR